MKQKPEPTLTAYQQSIFDLRPSWLRQWSGRAIINGKTIALTVGFWLDPKLESWAGGILLFVAVAYCLYLLAPLFVLCVVLAVNRFAKYAISIGVEDRSYELQKSKAKLVQKVAMWLRAICGAGIQKLSRGLYGKFDIACDVLFVAVLAITKHPALAVWIGLAIVLQHLLARAVRRSILSLLVKLDDPLEQAAPVDIDDLMDKLTGGKP